MYQIKFYFFFTSPLLKIFMAPCCPQDKISTPWPGIQDPGQYGICSPTALARQARAKSSRDFFLFMNGKKFSY